MFCSGNAYPAGTNSRLCACGKGALRMCKEFVSNCRLSAERFGHSCRVVDPPSLIPPSLEKHSLAAARRWHLSGEIEKNRGALRGASPPIHPRFPVLPVKDAVHQHLTAG
jgi:hypothetical protein